MQRKVPIRNFPKPLKIYPFDWLYYAGLLSERGQGMSSEIKYGQEKVINKASPIMKRASEAIHFSRLDRYAKYAIAMKYQGERRN